MPQIDLEEFVSDYLALEGAENDTNEDIAYQYVVATADAPLTPDGLITAVERIVIQLPYYTGKENA